MISQPRSSGNDQFTASASPISEGGSEPSIKPIEDDSSSTEKPSDHGRTQETEDRENSRESTPKVIKKETKDEFKIDSDTESSEIVPFAYEFIGKKEANVDIAERRKGRKKRLRQHGRYVWLVEDRLSYLEEEVLRLSKQPPEPESKDGPQSTILRIKEMRWFEYVVAKGDKVPTEHYAIDILTEEPVLFRQQSWGRRGEIETKITVTESEAVFEDGNNEGTFGPHLKKLPERIRINAASLCEALSTTIGEGALSYSKGYPIVMRAPFRFLWYHKDRIEFTAKRETLQKQEPSEDGSQKTGSKGSETDVVTTSTRHKLEDEISGDKSASETHNNSVDNELTQQLQLLLEFIRDYIKPTVDRVLSLHRVTFQELYYLFRPGDTVYVRKGDQPQKLWRVLQVTGGNRFLRQFDDLSYDEMQDAEAKRAKRDNFTPLALDCFFLTYDGFRIRRVQYRFTIPWFPDSQQIQNLPVVPFKIAQQTKLVNEEDIRSKAREYLDCIRPSHRLFRGKSVDQDSQGRRLKISSDPNRTLVSETVEGAVMVDFEKAFQYNQAWIPDFEGLQDYKRNPRELESSEDKKRETIQDDLIWDTRMKEEYLEGEAERSERWERGEILDDDALILPDRLPAFVLRSRKWVYLQLRYAHGRSTKEALLTKIEPKTTAWDDLQLPGGHQDHGHKYIIQSLVDKHFSKSIQLDLVKEKGRGLIILLHGAPGVGKTSTAECVAEARGKPLLPITCGDLGLEPEQVEAKLSLHFELAQSWDCILLLDEADVFLAARSLQDLQRNALVSVFLRILEYYEGILFLTTNKVGLIDEAFKSRIHMSLYYPWLTKDQTTTIWRSLLQRAKASQSNLVADETDLLLYAMDLYQNQTNSEHGRGPDGQAPGWNGRQIRNAFMSAISLAQYEARKSSMNQLEGQEVTIKEPDIMLTREHFRTVADASQQFDSYLYRVHAFTSDAKHAELSRSRYDSHITDANSSPQKNAEMSQGASQRSHSYYNSSLAPRPSTPVANQYQPSQHGQQRTSGGYQLPQPQLQQLAPQNQLQQPFNSFNNEGFQQRYQQPPQQQPFLASPQQQMNMYPPQQFTTGHQYQQPPVLPQTMDHTQAQQPQQQSQQQSNDHQLGIPK